MIILVIERFNIFGYNFSKVRETSQILSIKKDKRTGKAIYGKQYVVTYHVLPSDIEFTKPDILYALNNPTSKGYNILMYMLAVTTKLVVENINATIAPNEGLNVTIVFKDFGYYPSNKRHLESIKYTKCETLANVIIDRNYVDVLEIDSDNVSSVKLSVVGSDTYCESTTMIKAYTRTTMNLDLSLQGPSSANQDTKINYDMILLSDDQLKEFEKMYPDRMIDIYMYEVEEILKKSDELYGPGTLELLRNSSVYIDKFITAMEWPYYAGIHLIYAYGIKYGYTREKELRIVTISYPTEIPISDNITAPFYINTVDKHTYSVELLFNRGKAISKVDEAVINNTDYIIVTVLGSLFTNNNTDAWLNPLEEDLPGEAKNSPEYVSGHIAVVTSVDKKSISEDIDFGHMSGIKWVITTREVYLAKSRRTASTYYRSRMRQVHENLVSSDDIYYPIKTSQSLILYKSLYGNNGLLLVNLSLLYMTSKTNEEALKIISSPFVMQLLQDFSYELFNIEYAREYDATLTLRLFLPQKTDN
jgi:hypothetical protein